MAVIAPVGAISALPVLAAERSQPVPPVVGGFSDILANGLKSVDAKVAKADALIEEFAKGEPVPVHQVTMALEQARIAVDLAAQVRTRLLETYRDFMNMQL